jgi:lipopolysaccharide export system protein LptA
MRAQSNFIDYETRKWALILTGNVTVSKTDWEARSHSARYDLRRQRVLFTGKVNSRVLIVFAAPNIVTDTDD